MAVVITKELAGVEDFVFGFGTVLQSRGDITLVNSSHLPFTVTESVEVALLDRPTQAEGDLRFAKLNGNSTENFNVADATTEHHAVSYQQLATSSDLKADKAEVILKGDPLAYTPLSSNDPTNKGYVDATVATLRDDTLLKSNTTIYEPIGDYNPATKKYVDDAVASLLSTITTTFTTVDGKTITVTDGRITGVA